MKFFRSRHQLTYIVCGVLDPLLEVIHHLAGSLSLTRELTDEFLITDLFSFLSTFVIVSLYQPSKYTIETLTSSKLLCFVFKQTAFNKIIHRNLKIPIS